MTGKTQSSTPPGTSRAQGAGAPQNAARKKSTGKKDDATKMAAALNPAAAFVDMAKMAEQTQMQFQNALKGANWGADAWRDAAEDASYAVCACTEAAQAGAKSVSEEMMGLLRSEMTRFVDHANRLMRAKAFNEVLELNSAFLTETMEERLEKARELNKKSIEAARRTVEPLNNTMTAAMSRVAELNDAWTPND